MKLLLVTRTTEEETLIGEDDIDSFLEGYHESPEQSQTLEEEEGSTASSESSLGLASFWGRSSTSIDTYKDEIEERVNDDVSHIESEREAASPTIESVCVHDDASHIESGHRGDALSMAKSARHRPSVTTTGQLRCA